MTDPNQPPTSQSTEAEAQGFRRCLDYFLGFKREQQPSAIFTFYDDLDGHISAGGESPRDDVDAHGAATGWSLARDSTPDEQGVHSALNVLLLDESGVGVYGILAQLEIMTGTRKHISGTEFYGHESSRMYQFRVDGTVEVRNFSGAEEDVWSGVSPDELKRLATLLSDTSPLVIDDII